jgi:hypothetical protein
MTELSDPILIFSFKRISMFSESRKKIETTVPRDLEFMLRATEISKKDKDRTATKNIV